MNAEICLLECVSWKAEHECQCQPTGNLAGTIQDTVAKVTLAEIDSVIRRNFPRDIR